MLLLGNVRALDSETAKGDMEAHAKGEIVTTLAPLIDYYVCDAFGASHRSQCSLVGFSPKVPSASGRLMAKEMFALNAIFSEPRRPSVFILGGAKFGDVSEMIDRVLGNGTADTIILVGLAGNAYLLARGWTSAKWKPFAAALPGYGSPVRSMTETGWSCCTAAAAAK